MKSLRSVFFSAIMLLSLASCSKKSSDDATPASSQGFEGVWHGSVLTDATKVKAFYAFNFKKGGNLDRLDEKGDVVGTGNWTLANNILSANYKNGAGAKFTIMGAYNKSINKIIGNWGHGSSTSNGGTYDLTKK